MSEECCVGERWQLVELDKGGEEGERVVPGEIGVGDAEVQPPSRVLGLEVKGAVVSRKRLFRLLAIGKSGPQLVPQGVIAGKEEREQKVGKRPRKDMSVRRKHDKRKTNPTHLHLTLPPAFPPSLPIPGPGEQGLSEGRRSRVVVVRNVVEHAQHDLDVRVAALPARPAGGLVPVVGLEHELHHLVHQGPVAVLVHADLQALRQGRRKMGESKDR